MQNHQHDHYHIRSSSPHSKLTGIKGIRNKQSSGFEYLRALSDFRYRSCRHKWANFQCLSMTTPGYLVCRLSSILVFQVEVMFPSHVFNFIINILCFTVGQFSPCTIIVVSSANTIFFSSGLQNKQLVIYPSTVLFSVASLIFKEVPSITL